MSPGPREPIDSLLVKAQLTSLPGWERARPLQNPRCLSTLLVDVPESPRAGPGGWPLVALTEHTAPECICLPGLPVPFLEEETEMLW